MRPVVRGLLKVGDVFFFISMPHFKSTYLGDNFWLSHVGAVYNTNVEVMEEYLQRSIARAL
jgi:hypothetical protein